MIKMGEPVSKKRMLIIRAEQRLYNEVYKDLQAVEKGDDTFFNLGFPFVHPSHFLSL